MRRSVTRTGLARRQRHHRFAIRAWVNRLSGIPAFVIGNGPSLVDCDVKLLEPYFTIGINRAFYAIDPTILLWQDISLWNTEYHRLHSTQALKVSRDVSDPRKIYYNFHLKGGPYKFDPTSAHVLYGRGSTGPLGVQLAVAMGCAPIILLGMDCQRGLNNESDFYGDNKHWTDATLTNCARGLQFVAEECPVKVVNCGTSTFWPQEDLKCILPQFSSYQRTRQQYVRQILNLPEKNA